MNVGELMVSIEMNRWHRFLFWTVNVPRAFLGMDLVVYRCMMGVRPGSGFKKMRIKAVK